MGVADGLFAAGLAARVAAGTSRPLAARASNTQWRAVKLSASAAVLVVPHQQSRPFLSVLPLISLSDPISPLHPDEGGAEALLDVLWRLGIRMLGDLAALSEADVLGRFGWPGLLAHRLACGLDDRPLQAEAVGKDAGAEAEIDPPADRIETVAFMARSLADAMVARLARYGLDCVCIDIEAESDSGHASRRRWRHELRFNAAAVVDRVRWQLEGWYRSSERPTGPVTLIRITPCVVAPADGRQLGMWGARSEADERAAKALARLQGLLGAEAVTVPRLAGGRRPADTGRRVPLHAAEADAGPARDPSAATVNRGKGKKGKGRKSAKTTKTGATRARTAKSGKAAEPADAPWPGRLPPPQPAVVLDRPEPITVTDRDGDPRHCQRPGRNERGTVASDGLEGPQSVRRRLGRAVAARRALVAPVCPPPPSPDPASPQRRLGSSLRAGVRPLAARGHLRLSARAAASCSKQSHCRAAPHRATPRELERAAARHWPAGRTRCRPLGPECRPGPRPQWALGG